MDQPFPQPNFSIADRNAGSGSSESGHNRPFVAMQNTDFDGLLQPPLQPFARHPQSPTILSATTAAEVQALSSTRGPREFWRPEDIGTWHLSRNHRDTRRRPSLTCRVRGRGCARRSPARVRNGGQALSRHLLVSWCVRAAIQRDAGRNTTRCGHSR